MKNEAVLSNDRSFTSFMFNGHNIRFKTSPRLERYTKVVEWDNGYLVVMAKYEGCEEEEEYIDLVPILENLYFNADDFLKPIQKERLKNEPKDHRFPHPHLSNHACKTCNAGGGA